jgi:hypothetical protein
LHGWVCSARGLNEAAELELVSDDYTESEIRDQGSGIRDQGLGKLVWVGQEGWAGLLGEEGFEEECGGNLVDEVFAIEASGAAGGAGGVAGFV